MSLKVNCLRNKYLKCIWNNQQVRNVVLKQVSIMNKKRSIFTLMIILHLTISCRTEYTTIERLTSELKFENPLHGFISSKPATIWEESMISGNGTLGILIPGHPNKDRFVLSHESIFMPKFAPAAAPDLGSRLDETRNYILSGEPEKAADILVQEGQEVGIDQMIWTNPHIPACQIDFEALDPINVSNYARSVNYETGEAKVALGDGSKIIHRNAFVSRSDSVAVIQFNSPSGHKLNYRFRLNQLPNVKEEIDDVGAPGTGNLDDFENEFNTANYVDSVNIQTKGEYLMYSTSFKKKWEGSLKGYTVLTKILPVNGTVKSDGNWIFVEGADEILLISGIKLFYEQPSLDISLLKNRIDAIVPDYDVLKSSHEQIHSEMFNRFSFGLGNDTQLQLTSEELLESSTMDNFNNELIVQLMKAARYNIISSTGKLPPTLQGIWGGTWWPAWSGDFTFNGNVPSAIASGLNTNFPEITKAYLDLMTEWFEDYRYNAKNLFGKEGIFVPSRASDFGSCFHYSRDYPHLYWWSGTTWPCQFFYDYWLYTGDEEFLKTEAIPFMMEAYRFMKDILYEYAGTYNFIPSYSAEQGPKGRHPLAINATMDVASFKQLLRNLITLAEQGWIDSLAMDEYKNIHNKLPDYAIDANGELKEWIWEGFENNNEHRHASHLYPLYDGVDPEFTDNSDLTNAAIKAIESRLEYRRPQNGGEMAFGLVQLGTASAHLKDIDHAYECVKWLCSSYWTPAFVSYHNPGEIFNMDISGGLPALVTYMLIQSTPEKIELLPALPKEWASGSIKGALSRGNFKIDLKWQEGIPEKIKVVSLSGNETKIVFKDKEWKVNIPKGDSIILE